jgi:FKBP-type peptidyl-prolyl cis-trans isomerase (trigger factor)
MKVEVNDAPNSQKVLSVELPYEVLSNAESLECEKIAQTAIIPGFRPGKAPKEQVKKRLR